MFLWSHIILSLLGIFLEKCLPTRIYNIDERELADHFADIFRMSALRNKWFLWFDTVSMRKSEQFLNARPNNRNITIIPLHQVILCTAHKHLHSKNIDVEMELQIFISNASVHFYQTTNRFTNGRSRRKLARCYRIHLLLFVELFSKAKSVANSKGFSR